MTSKRIYLLIHLAFGRRTDSNIKPELAYLVVFKKIFFSLLHVDVELIRNIFFKYRSTTSITSLTQKTWIFWTNNTINLMLEWQRRCWKVSNLFWEFRRFVAKCHQLVWCYMSSTGLMHCHQVFWCHMSSTGPIPYYVINWDGIHWVDAICHSSNYTKLHFFKLTHK